MEFKELTTVKFLGASNVKNSISWSEDDKIAVVTQKGVNILDLCLSRKNSTSDLDFVRSLIIPPSAYPTYETGIKTDEVFVRAEKDQVYQMMMDPILYSGLKITETQPAITLQAAWSKAGMADAQGCLLAIRQNTGSVVVFLSKKTSWEEVINISQLWLKHLKELVWPQEKSSGKDIYSILTSRVNQIEATGISWSQVVTESNCVWSLLFVAHRDGSIVAWKVEKTGKGSTCNISCSIAFQLSMSGMSRISHISWHAYQANQGLLIVGDIHGVAKYVLMTDLIASAHTPHEAHEIWGERDMIAVTGAMASAASGVWFLAVAKSSCIVALAMSHSGTQLAKTIANLGSLDISGLISMTGDSVVLVTQCGAMNRIVLAYSADQQELELECIDMSSKFDSANFIIQGLTVSRNKLIFATSLSIAAPHDHLSLREATEIVFFTYSTFENAWSYLIKQHPLSSLYKCWDYLELIRILGHNIPWKLDFKALMQSNENPNLAWWLVIIKQVAAKESSDNLMEMKQKLEDRILCRHANNVLSRLKETPFESLSLEEKCSVSLFSRWLQNYANTADGSKLVDQDVLNSTQQIETIVEKCDICGSDVNFTSSTEAKCDEGHILPRCSLSLLQCSSVPQRTCHTCNLSALQHPVFNQDPKCIYCYRPLELDGYF